MDGRKYGCTNRQNFSPFGAAALLPSDISKYQRRKEAKGTADRIVPLGDWIELINV